MCVCPRVGRDYGCIAVLCGATVVLGSFQVTRLYIFSTNYEAMCYFFLCVQVVSLCQEAALCAMHEDIAAEQVSQRHFQEALAVVKPQTDQSTLQFFDSYSKSGGTKATV